MKPEGTLGRVVEFFAEKGVLAIGIGSFGPVDLNVLSSSYGSIPETPKPYWSGFNIVAYLKRYFDVTWGAAAGLDSCLYLTVGTGIGAGAIVEGKLVHGLIHPEMGHILVRRH